MAKSDRNAYQYNKARNNEQTGGNSLSDSSNRFRTQPFSAVHYAKGDLSTFDDVRFVLNVFEKKKDVFSLFSSDESVAFESVISLYGTKGYFLR